MGSRVFPVRWSVKVAGEFEELQLAATDSNFAALRLCGKPIVVPARREGASNLKLKMTRPQIVLEFPC